MQPVQHCELLEIQKPLRHLLFAMAQLVQPLLNRQLIDHHSRRSLLRARPQRELQLRIFVRCQARVHVAHAAIEAIAGFVVAPSRAGMQMHGAHVIAGVAHAEAVAPHHIGDAIVAARKAEREATGIEQALGELRIGAHAPHILRPVGVVVEMEAGVPRVITGERQEGFRRVEACCQVLQPFIEIDVGIEQ